MVKNHSKKNDARNLIANTGQNLTSALDAVSGGTKPSYLSGVKYPSEPWGDKLQYDVTHAAFVKWVDEYVGEDTVRQSVYDELYSKGFGNGSEIAKLYEDWGYGIGFGNTTPEEISKYVPTSAQLVEHYGTWHEVCLAADLKTFNENKLPLFDGSIDGVSDYPSWVGPIGWGITAPERSGFTYNMDLFSDKANELLLGSDGVDPNGELAAVELAFLYADMATALRTGATPEPAVLAQWQANAEQFMGEGAVPTGDQIVVLEAARDYLKL